jgi:predicted unusual protein kinase regulating ubiquinone biosynthesis (AarF/ABC1/UbiB family)
MHTTRARACVSHNALQQARATMEQSLGRRLEDVFEDARAFEKPVAAASLGQVSPASTHDKYKYKLNSANMKSNKLNSANMKSIT